MRELDGVLVMRPIVPWWREPDHYYPMTAALAAEGAQSRVCRLIAALTFGFGVLQAAMLWSPAGPRGSHAQLIAMSAVVCSLVLALFWLRRRWPTRAQSLVFVIVAAICIAAGSLTKSEPVGGFVAAMAFAVLSAYVVFLHTARYVVYALVAALAVVSVLVTRLSTLGDPVWAWYLAGSVIAVDISVPVICQAMVRLIHIDVPDGEIETLTGLLNRDAFYSWTATLIASRDRSDDRYLILAVISLDHFSLLTGFGGVTAGERARVAIARMLRETTRGDAVIAHVDETEFLVADSLPFADPTPLVERIRSAIKSTPPHVSVSIGVVSVPLSRLATNPPESLLGTLIDSATATMRRARRAGGNQSRHTALAGPPGPDALGEPDSAV